MKKTYFTVGPTQLFPTIAKHTLAGVKAEIGSLSHRGKEFESMVKAVKTSLRKLLGIPVGYEIFFLASGNEAMERILENTVEKDSYHIITGAFSQKFYDFAKKLGKDPKKITAKPGTGLTLDQMHIPKSAEVICFTQNETSTGVWISEKIISEAKRQNPASLIAVDIVSSAPHVNLDYSKTDCVFFSVQKGFGMPSGLCVLIVSPDAMEKSFYLEKTGFITGTYHNFSTLKIWSDKNQTPDTPPVFEIYLLEKVLKDMLKIGIKKIRKTTEKKAQILYDFFDKNTNFSAFVKEPEFRSPTIVIPIIGKQTEKIKTKLAKQGLIVASGYGVYKDTQIRIANFQAHTESDIRKLILTIKKIK